MTALSVESMVSLITEVLIWGVLFVAGYYIVFRTKQYKHIRPQNTDESPEKPKTDPTKPAVNYDETVLGYIDGSHGDEMFVIPESDRQNISIFGEIGSGKTSIMRLLIMQDIARKRGFLLIDPHRDFSREVLSMIPPDMQDKVVYISLASLYQFGRTVCINPLQTTTDHEKHIRTAGCIDSLKQYFSDGWGHRLETVLRNMMNLVLSTPGTFKFLDIIMVLFNEGKRNEALQRCTNPTVRDFWLNVFPKFAPEAAGAIYNKFDKIVSTPPIAAMFSSAESTISIKDIIEDGKIVIVDLGSSATVDIVEFMGTLIINTFNLENKIRFDLGDHARTPFNIYIDEVHMFSPSVIRELANNVRKYNMKLTVATQSIKVLDDHLAREIDDLFRCMVMFRCDFETARLLARNLPLDEKQLGQLGFHRFAAFSQGFSRVAGVGKTRHIEIPSRWENVAKKSLEKYGKEVPIDAFSFASKKGSIIPKLTPLEYFLLTTLYLEKRDVNQGELMAASIAKFGVDARTVTLALVNSLYQHHGFVVRNTDYHDGKNQYDTNISFAITKHAISEIYSRAFAGPGAGGDLHVGVISAIADRQMEQFHYCIPDLGDTGGKRADLVVYEFQKMLESTKSAAPYGKLNPQIWSENVIAVEVETDPTKHPEQIVINYEKNVSLGMRVWFVVFKEPYKTKIMDYLADANVGKEDYDIVLVDPKSIDLNNNMQYADASESVSDMESKVLEGIGTGYSTLSDIVNKTSLTASQVMICIQSMEKSGKVERSGVTKTVTKQSLDLTGVKKTHTKKDTFSISPHMLQKASPVPSPDDGDVVAPTTTVDDNNNYDNNNYDNNNKEIPESYKTNAPDSKDTGPSSADDAVLTDPEGKYTKSEVGTLRLLLETDGFEGYDAVCEELKRRGLGVKRKNSGKVKISPLGDKK